MKNNKLFLSLPNCDSMMRYRLASWCTREFFLMSIYQCRLSYGFSHKNKHRRESIVSKRLASRREMRFASIRDIIEMVYRISPCSNLIETRREPWRYRADNPKILIGWNLSFFFFERECPECDSKKTPERRREHRYIIVSINDYWNLSDDIFHDNS